MSKIEIFDPAMCCPTGVCGPSVDPELTRVATAIFSLEKLGKDITRYNLANEPDPFIQNTEVNKLLNEKGPDCLPIVIVNSVVTKVGEYPTNEELAAWVGVDVKELTPQKPKTSLNIKLN